MTSGQRVVVLDVDGVIADGRRAASCEANPSMRLLTDVLACLGYELVAWSSGGGEHAQSVVEVCGLHGAVRRCLDKPEYPMTEAAALEALGERPVLQIDDDPTERVADWPFFLVDPAFVGT